MNRILKASKLLGLAIIIGLFASACSCKCYNKAEKKTSSDISIYDGDWHLIKIGSSNVKLSQDEQKISLTLTEGNSNFSGYSGCNRYFGAYTINEGELELGNAGVTMMACPDIDMSTERKYLDNLNKVDSYRIEDDTLYLSGRGRVLLTFVLGG